jgi:hypothetical protein
MLVAGEVLLTRPGWESSTCAALLREYSLRYLVYRVLPVLRLEGTACLNGTAWFRENSLC